MKYLLLFSLVTAAAPSFGDSYTSRSCEDSDFLQGAWQELVAKEPIIASTLRTIGNESGEPGPVVPVTNCYIKWPVDEKGESVEGIRMAIIDKVWKNSDNTTSQGGMKILYSLRTKQVNYIDGTIGYTKTRNIKGLVICRGPETCEALDIPFKKSEKPPATKSDAKLPLKPGPSSEKTGPSPKS